MTKWFANPFSFKRLPRASLLQLKVSSCECLQSVPCGNLQRCHLFFSMVISYHLGRLTLSGTGHTFVTDFSIYFSTSRRNAINRWTINRERNYSKPKDRRLIDEKIDFFLLVHTSGPRFARRLPQLLGVHVVLKKQPDVVFFSLKKNHKQFLSSQIYTTS